VPVRSGHVQVEQQHVRAGGGDDVYRLPAVSGFAGDLDVWFLAEQVAQPVADEAVVVGDHHPDTGDRRSPSPPGRITADTRVIITQSPIPWAETITRVSRDL
jgi:hypothetical protein